MIDQCQNFRFAVALVCSRMVSIWLANKLDDVESDFIVRSYECSGS